MTMFSLDAFAERLDREEQERLVVQEAVDEALTEQRERIAELEARVAELETSNARLRLALVLLLAGHDGMEGVLDLLKRQRSAVGVAGEVRRIKDLEAALLDVQRHGDLRGEEVPDGAD